MIAKTVKKISSTSIAVSVVAISAAVAFATLPEIAVAQSGTSQLAPCHSVNACKGQSQCKTAMNACKGQNSCKGQGILMTTADECLKLGGKYEGK